MRPFDWVVVLDAGLCNRFSHCTACGRRLTDTADFRVWTRRDGLAMPLAICPACTKADPAGAVVTTKMEQRYGP